MLHMHEGSGGSGGRVPAEESEGCYRIRIKRRCPVPTRLMPTQRRPTHGEVDDSGNENYKHV